MSAIIEAICTSCGGAWTYGDPPGTTVVCALCEHTFSLPGPAPEAKPVIAPPAWRVGDSIDGLYEVRALLGEGGMGQVFRVYHRSWQLDLAVKCPRPEMLVQPGSRESFVQEAETWVGLGIHPNIVTCHYVREIDGLPRVFVELVEGGSLADRIASRAIYAGGARDAFAAVLDAAIQLAWALGYAHEMGLVHQDVKPANAMMTNDGTLKLTDFGIARSQARDAGDASVAYGGRTDKYCSPEQREQKRVTAKSDLWSWGLTVLEMFQGDSPWMSGVAAMDALEGLLEAGPDAAEAPPILTDVAGLLRRCFQDDPNARPASMRVVADDLAVIYRTSLGRTYPRAVPAAGELLADSLNNRAISLLDLGSAEEAREALRRARLADPMNVRACFNSGLLDFREGRRTDTEIELELERVAEREPNDWEIRWLLGCFYAERGDARAKTALAAARAAAGGDERALEAIARTERALRPATRMVAEATIPDARAIAGCASGVAVITNDALAWCEGGRLTVQWVRPTARPVCVAVSPDGRVCATADDGGTITLWEARSGAPFGSRRHALHKAPKRQAPNVTHLSLSAEGRVLAIAGGDGELSVVDTSTGREMLRQRVSPSESWVTGVDVSPDGASVVAVSANLSHEDPPFHVLVWRRAAGEAPWTWSESRDGAVDPTLALLNQMNAPVPRNAVALSADACAALITSQLDDRVTMLDLATRTAVRAFRAEHPGVRSVDRIARGAGVFATTGWRPAAVTGWPHAAVHVRDEATGRRLCTAVEAGRDVAWVGARLVTLAEGGRLRASEIAEPRLAPFAVVRPRALTELSAAQATFEAHMTAARGARDGDRLAEEVSALRAARAVPGYARAPTALAHNESLVGRTWRGAYREAWVERRSPPLRHVVIAADGRRFVAAGTSELSMWDVDTGALVWKESLGGASIQGLAAAADLSCVVTHQTDGTLWAHSPGRQFLIPWGREFDVAVDSAGRFAVGVSSSSMVRLWPLVQGARPREVDLGGPVSLVALAGDTIVGVEADAVRFGSAEGARPPRSFATPSAARPVALAVSQDGNRIFVARDRIGTEGSVVDVLDGATGRPVGSLFCEARIEALALSADGLALVADRGVHLWDTATGKLLDVLSRDQPIQSIHGRPPRRVTMSADATRIVACGQESCCVYYVDWEREAAARR